MKKLNLQLLFAKYLCTLIFILFICKNILIKIDLNRDTEIKSPEMPKMSLCSFQNFLPPFSSPSSHSVVFFFHLFDLYVPTSGLPSSYSILAPSLFSAFHSISFVLARSSSFLTPFSVLHRIPCHLLYFPSTPCSSTFFSYSLLPLSTTPLYTIYSFLHFLSSFSFLLNPSKQKSPSLLLDFLFPPYLTPSPHHYFWLFVPKHQCSIHL